MISSTEASGEEGFRRSHRLSWIKGTVAVFSHEMRHTLASPYFVIGSLMQPILYLYLFGPVLTGLAELNNSTSSGSYGVLVPALFIQLAVFGGAFVGISLISEYRSGSFERLFATPMSRTSILAGKVLRDAVTLTLSMVLVLFLSLPLGFRIGWKGLIINAVLVFLTALTFSSLSYFVAISTKQEDALSSIFNSVLLPLILLAGVMVPVDYAPHWLKVASHWNPLTYIVDAARRSSAGLDGIPVITGTLIAVVFAAVSFLLAAKAFNSRS